MLKSIFTWWNGATIGARFDIGRRASYVGADDTGNKYYEERKASLEGRKRRYVIYNGYAEPSKVPAEWHGWLHHTFDKPPTIGTAVASGDTGRWLVRLWEAFTRTR